MTHEPAVDAAATPDSPDTALACALAGVSADVTSTAQWPMDAPDLQGRVLAHRYALTALLGSGGMGHVFKALDWQRRELNEADRHVAVKVLRHQDARGANLLAALRREFYCAQALAHPNIVKVFELGQDGDLAFFTMELLDGEPLSAVLNRTLPQPLPRERAWALIRDIGAGVAHAHSRLVVHGDLKPANVMVTKAGEVRILDFGASGSIRRTSEGQSDALQRDAIPAVTPAYTCCELLAGLQADPRDDLYALACIAYQLLSGEHPFQGRSALTARRHDMVPRRPPGLRLRQWQAIRQGLAWSREQRSVAIDEWLERLGVPLGTTRLPRKPWLPLALAKRRVRRPSTLGSPRQAALGAGLLASVCALLAQNLPLSGDQERSTQPGVPLISGAVAAGVAAPASAAHSAVTLRDAPPPSKARNVRITVEGFRVLPGDNFAQITIVRSAAEGQLPFTWWTEEASAKPGSDFVTQHPATHLFTHGRRTTTVFVRLLPNRARKDREMFYVNIGRPDGGPAPRIMARTAVWIPPVADAMVASN